MQNRKKPKSLYKSPSRLIQTIIDLKGKKYKRKNAINVITPMKPKKEPYQYQTARNESHEKGKRFLKTFKKFEIRKRKNNFVVEAKTQGTCAIESKNTIVLIDRSKRKPSVLARIGIGFEKEAIILEVIQGRKKGEEERNAFRSLTKSNWPNFMINQIEQHARECGFKEIKIRRPETLHAYQLQGPEIQKQIRTLYYSIAEKMGFEKKWPYFEKKL